MSLKSTSRDKQAIWRLIYKIIALISIPITVFFTISYIESLSDRQIADLLEIFNFSKFGIAFNSALTVFLLLLFGFFIFFPLIRLIQKFFSALTGKYFVISLATLAVLGAVAALYIPSSTNWFKPDTQQSTGSTQPTQNGQGSGNQQNQSSKDPSSDLRLHLLYITGGVIAVLGLIETNRKNSQDHIRQVHADRRDRYIEAVDKLSSEDAPVRLGGVYALAGLIDEWLSDENIDRNTRVKEGQVIINNLCAYIRSPFSPAARVEEHQAYRYYEDLKRDPNKDPITQDPFRFAFLFARFFPNNYQEPDTLVADTDAFHEEQDVRRTIFTEMSKRSSTLRIGKNIDDVTIIPGAWSDFDFDFSRAPIFYSLDNLTIEKPYFPHARFYGDASFNTTKFTKNADFSHAFYSQKMEFRFARFFRPADFTLAHFFQDVDFMFTRFSQGATFNYARFSETANFIKATFSEEADFSKATFNETAEIGGVTFAQKADFSNTTFSKIAEFTNTTFTQKVDFGNTTFKKYEPTFVSENSSARFSVHSAQRDYNFSVHRDSKPIPPGEAELDGVKRQIPAGTVLFDPASKKDKSGNYKQSEPAKPIDKFDNQGETPSK